MGKLGIAIASITTLLAVNTAKAQFIDIPEFSYKYKVDAGVVATDENIFWTSKKLPNGIQELRGHVDLEAGLLFFGDKFYLGMITEIDRKNKTIKSIVYDDENSDKFTISEYDKKIIKKYTLDPEKVKNITSEIFDYKNKIVTDLETKIQRPLYDNELGFQEGYFMSENSKNKDTTLTLQYRGNHYDIALQQFFDKEEKRNRIYIDMTISDSENPGKRKNVIVDIDYLDIYIGKEGIPEKISTTINLLWGINVDVTIIK